jgi:uncharacterized protein YkwD
MKLINTIILLLISVLSFSQTKLDSLVLSKINSYRVSKGLDVVKFSTIDFNAANHHSKYLSGKSYISHAEDKLTTPMDRYKFFGGNKYASVGENVLSYNLNVKDSDMFLDKISTEVVDMWKKSPGHNEILLTKEYKFAGVSCVTISSDTGIKGWKNIEIVATFVTSSK